ncbi:MAG: hypothetical protein II234_00060 [Clostridia bacterium]|nr:hypothetical protein [Clostridia bacterium]
MTNEEWIKGLSTEDFARWLSCKSCPHNSYTEPCGLECDAQIEWLKAVHDENN